MKDTPASALTAANRFGSLERRRGSSRWAPAGVPGRGLYSGRVVEKLIHAGYLRVTEFRIVTGRRIPWTVEPTARLPEPAGAVPVVLTLARLLGFPGQL
jgi:hypothetical protein